MRILKGRSLRTGRPHRLIPAVADSASLSPRAFARAVRIIHPAPTPDQPHIISDWYQAWCPEHHHVGDAYSAKRIDAWLSAHLDAHNHNTEHHTPERTPALATAPERKH